MKKILFGIIISVFILNVTSVFAATVIKKEEADLFSRKSIYSDVNAGETLPAKTDSSSDEHTGFSVREDDLNRFTCMTATKEGNNTYYNPWSNYKLVFEEPFLSAKDDYDFYADGVKFDFGVFFEDWSRIAIYYSRLSKDINVVAANFAPGKPVTDVVIAGEIYKHVTLDVPYPYGVEKYDYYLRNIDGKLMVIETYWEDDHQTSKKYIDKIVKYK